MPGLLFIMDDDDSILATVEEPWSPRAMQDWTAFKQRIGNEKRRQLLQVTPRTSAPN